MNAISRPFSETPADRRTRQLDYFRRAAEKAMRAVDIAGDQLEAAHATGEPGATASPTLDLARATRALVLAVNAENRVIAGQAPLRAPASDTRRALLREPLHRAADAEPDPKLRAALHRDIDDRIEDALVTDPDSEIELIEHLGAIADDSTSRSTSPSCATKSSASKNASTLSPAPNPAPTTASNTTPTTRNRRPQA